MMNWPVGFFHFFPKSSCSCFRVISGFVFCLWVTSPVYCKHRRWWAKTVPGAQVLLEAGPSSTQALVTIYFRAEELLMRYLYIRSSNSCNEYLLSMWHSKAPRGAFEFRVFLEANKWCCLWVQAGTWDAGRSKGSCGKTMQKRMSLHMRVLYEDLTDDPGRQSYRSILIMKVRNFKRFCIQWWHHHLKNALLHFISA